MNNSVIGINEAEAEIVEVTSSHAISASGFFKGQRVADFLLSAVGIIVTSPLIIVRSLISVIKERQLLASSNSDGDVAPARFAGEFAGAGLASLFSVISGKSVSYTHLTLPTTLPRCRSRWGADH